LIGLSVMEMAARSFFNAVERFIASQPLSCMDRVYLTLFDSWRMNNCVPMVYSAGLSNQIKMQE